MDFIEVGKSYIETPALTALLAEPAVSRAVSDRVRQLRGVIPRKWFLSSIRRAEKKSADSALQFPPNGRPLLDGRPP